MTSTRPGWFFGVVLFVACAPEPSPQPVPEGASARLLLGATRVTMTTDETLQLTATVAGPAGSVTLARMGYSSTAPLVVQVTPSGLLTAVGPGEARVDVRAELLPDGPEQEASLTVEVRGAGAPAVLIEPAIDDTSPTVGQRLTLDRGQWSGQPTPTLSSQLLKVRAGAAPVEISGATQGTYTVTAADVGQGLRLRVTAQSSSGVTVAESELTQPVKTASAPAATRDPLVQPFASTSIWNQPIGDRATYADCSLPGTYPNNVWAVLPGAEVDVLIHRPTAPMTNVYQGPWSTDRTVPTQPLTVVTTAPIPTQFVWPSQSANLAVAVLLADGRTYRQFQPIARAVPGGPVVTHALYADADLWGDGIRGAHGGSAMSSVGGTLRLGELRPGHATGPRHALKATVDMKYAHRPRGTVGSAAWRQDAYVWPSNKADSNSEIQAVYGVRVDGSFKMGSLLAIPRGVDLAAQGFETSPGRNLAWTAQNYGIYVVDNAYDDAFLLAVEGGPDGAFLSQFQADYGFSFAQRQQTGATASAASPASAWRRDLSRLIELLAVVTNNSASTIGGGGVPLQAPAPPLRPAP
ncbi:MAG: hypothetical protein JNK82_27595 [Myxococcaceae bacterium]|nr:hypothetical protein [Myxococcaceae bacterium]